ncbi:integration host factor subunit beta [Candidatus Pelagibacter sp.]|nr:integration host factor subunit beta [Candidatus Pelagibacter sp.]
MAINKSDIIKQLKKSYPNFLKRDLEKMVSVILNEIKNTIKRLDSVELRGFGTLRPRIQKARISRNPATGEKVNTPKKINVHWKQSKEMFKKINDEE